MPKVSVIIPTRNRSNLLQVAITSVLNQTFQDFEIIVVDDASTDAIAEIVSGFVDDRIRYVRHQIGRGGSAARNTGIRNSNGEYVAFLDDDDEWFPEKLKLQIALLESSPRTVGVVYAGYWIVDRASGRINGQKIPEKRGDLSDELLAGNSVGGTSIVLARRECFDRVGLFDETLPSFQDYDLWIRISKEFHFDFIPSPLCNYYVHDNKISTDVEALRKGIEILLAKHGNSPALRRYLSYRYLFLGVNYCERGNARDGRGAFRNAIKLYPFGIRHYFNFCLSLLGARTFKRIKGTKETIKASMKSAIRGADC